MQAIAKAHHSIVKNYPNYCQSNTC